MKIEIQKPAFRLVDFKSTAAGANTPKAMSLAYNAVHALEHKLNPEGEDFDGSEIMGNEKAYYNVMARLYRLQQAQAAGGVLPAMMRTGLKRMIGRYMWDGLDSKKLKAINDGLTLSAGVLNVHFDEDSGEMVSESAAVGDSPVNNKTAMTKAFQTLNMIELRYNPDQEDSYGVDLGPAHAQYMNIIARIYRLDRALANGGVLSPDARKKFKVLRNRYEYDGLSPRDIRAVKDGLDLPDSDLDDQSYIDQ